MRGIDVSNYQPADLTELIRVNKAEHVVVRLSTESQDHFDIAVAQLKSAKANGCSLSGYIWCYWDMSPEWLIASALDVLGAAGLGPPDVGTIWLDVEERGPATGSIALIWPWLNAAIKAVQDDGYRVGIYTGKWFWDAFMPGVAVYGLLPLWVADYNNKPDLDVALFGGWQRCAGHQYSADGIDLDVFDESVV